MKIDKKYRNLLGGIAIILSLVSSCIPICDSRTIAIFTNRTNDTLFIGASHYYTIDSKRVRDAAFFLIIMLVTFAATLLKPQKYVSSRTIQKCVEHVSTST